MSKAYGKLPPRELPPRDDDDRLLDRGDAAEFLGLSPNTLAVWAMAGKHIPVVRFGRRVKYRMGDLREYIARSTSPANPGKDAA